VEEGPDRQPRDVVEDEDEIGVLQGGVMPSGKEIGVELHGPLAAMGAIGRLDRAEIGGIRLVDQLAHGLDLRRLATVAAPGRGHRQGERVLR
jgi:hypothetical protein